MNEEWLITAALCLKDAQKVHAFFKRIANILDIHLKLIKFIYIHNSIQKFLCMIAVSVQCIQHEKSLHFIQCNTIKNDGPFQ